MNRHKEKGNSILNRQKDYQRKHKFILGNGKFSLKMLCHFAKRIMDLQKCMLVDRLSGDRKLNQNR